MIPEIKIQQLTDEVNRLIHDGNVTIEGYTEKLCRLQKNLSHLMSPVGLKRQKPTINVPQCDDGIASVCGIDMADKLLNEMEKLVKYGLGKGK